MNSNKSKSIRKSELRFQIKLHFNRVFWAIAFSFYLQK
ncbi:hypothetical protein AWU68_2138 [Corynebacterium simulans]|uniref:Uncharacterized protein n=1 Tax=Corynebacterium simulans TaxID=146827 RepID=A0ABR5V8H0_9CORY|nr:hypothetical protein AWU68_2138 [Corynebacterium simulans]KXU17603.1 hypothetical protein WM41_1748 [Corynebacterium simulans]